MFERLCEDLGTVEVGGVRLRGLSVRQAIAARTLAGEPPAVGAGETAQADWYARLQERTAVPMMAEYVHMLALEAAMVLEKNSAKSRVEALLAVKLARANKREMEARVERQREAAAKSGGNR